MSVQIELNDTIVANKMRSDQDTLKYIFNNELWEITFKKHKIRCINRIISNIIYEIISLICILLYLILFGKWMDGNLTIKHSNIVWLLLPAAIEYGIIPYVQTFMGFFFDKNDKEIFKVYSEFKSSCNGFLNHRMFIILWDSMLGARILSFGCFFITIVLYVLYSYELINLGFCFIPLAVYSIVFETLSVFAFNVVSCPNGCREYFTLYRIFHTLFLYSSILISCILTMIKLFGFTTWMYTTLAIPWSISIGLIPFVNVCEFCVASLLCVCYWNSHDDLKRLDEKMGMDNFFAKRGSDCSRSCIDTALFSIFSPLLITSIILFALRFENILSCYFFSTLIPLIVIISFLILLNGILLCCLSKCRCPYTLCPDSCWCKSICCCLCFSKKFPSYIK